MTAGVPKEQVTFETSDFNRRLLRRKLTTADGVRVRVLMRVTINRAVEIVEDIRRGAFAPELIQELRMVQSTMSSAAEIILVVFEPVWVVVKD